MVSELVSQKHPLKTLIYVILGSILNANIKPYTYVLIMLICNFYVGIVSTIVGRHICYSVT